MHCRHLTLQITQLPLCSAGSYFCCMALPPDTSCASTLQTKEVVLYSNGYCCCMGLPEWGRSAMTLAVLICLARCRCTFACSLLLLLGTICPPSVTNSFRNSRFLKSADAITSLLPCTALFILISLLGWKRTLGSGANRSCQTPQHCHSVQTAQQFQC